MVKWSWLASVVFAAGAATGRVTYQARGAGVGTHGLRQYLLKDCHFTQRIHRDTFNTEDADTNNTDKRERNDTDRSKKHYIHELPKNYHQFCTDFPCLYIGHGRLCYTREPLHLLPSLSHLENMLDEDIIAIIFIVIVD